MAQVKLLEEFLSTVRGVHATSGGTKETSYYTGMARRLAALVLLQPALDKNYQSVATATWALDKGA